MHCDERTGAWEVVRKYAIVLSEKISRMKWASDQLKGAATPKSLFSYSFEYAL